MVVSILHRISGGALTVAGLALLVWWLTALAAGDAAYSTFAAAAGHPVGILILIGLSWAFFQHLLSGLRHLFMDAGQALELGVNKTSAIATLVGSIVLTVALWVLVLGVVA